MRIVFATMAAIQKGEGGPTSHLASARYRVLIPARQLARLGHQVQVATLPGEAWPASVRELPCDVLVISKSGHAANEDLARAMKARGVRVVVDYCDDHFEHPQYGAHFHALAKLADTIVASTEAMAETIRRHTGREARVVTDPVEGPRGAPAFAPRLPALRLAWFGHPTNLAAIAAKSAELTRLAERWPVRFAIVTSPIPEAHALAATLAQNSRIHAAVVPWSPAATWEALAACDAVWLPLVESEKAAVKSPNRLLESVWAGRFVVADEIPAYRPFADLLPVGRALDETIAQALDDPAGIEARLLEAQRRVARDHSAFECGRRWARALGDADDRPLKLNLGCGDKILPGYVNVDVVEARAGMRPDVICDLHDLVPFGDASADEILSVHVVEHFWRWEVRDVLREWMRVLKPGGRMVIECPNLASACSTFLENPAQNAREDQAGQRTMWVFYGDPKWKDPLMIHRWGYTPESLAALLGESA